MSTDFSTPKYWLAASHTKLTEAAKNVPKLPALLADDSRNEKLVLESDGFICDFQRQKVTPAIVSDLLALAKERHLSDQINAMFSGAKINQTEGRAVLHVALRTPAGQKITLDGHDVVPDVHAVLKSIESFSARVRSGEFKGFTGKTLTDVICVGIGGSYLGPEFVLEAIRTHAECAKGCAGRRLRFLANVDPIDVARATEGLCPETTLVVIISKTFTTAETMLNARTLKKWLLDTLKDEKAISHHMCAVSTNLAATSEFGIDSSNVFGFWDWVGGRFSVCSAVGCVPLALHFGFSHVDSFLKGCNSMDNHFKSAPLEKNMPVMSGLISMWNSTYQGHGDVAVLPYCQALLRFAAHIQQLTMESNGKRVQMDGTVLPCQAGEVFFGEPGTNGQHSFYQLLHQGRVVPADFIGFKKSQTPVTLNGEPVSNHDELMSNFFAQPDALAYGKSAEQVRAEGVAEPLVEHKIFSGDRPSTCILMDECTPFNVGRLLAFYEHRTAVQGFMWGLNSFDQWGVELGKVLAKTVRAALGNPADETLMNKLPKPTIRMMKKYLEK